MVDPTWGPLISNAYIKEHARLYFVRNISRFKLSIVQSKLLMSVANWNHPFSFPILRLVNEITITGKRCCIKDHTLLELASKNNYEN